MEYVTDDQGQIKVMDEKGNHKYLPVKIVEDFRLMKRMGFTPVSKPAIFEPASNNSNVADSASSQKKQTNK